MTAKKHLVTIKGVKEGLIFLLDDQCRLADLLTELQIKLGKKHQQLLHGPSVEVEVRLGKRQLPEADKEHIREIIRSSGSLLIRSVESQVNPPLTAVATNGMKLLKGIVRSGQTISHEGQIILLGDINPGGSVFSGSDILIMGSLRGMAHAGINGNEQAIIAASHMRPTQLRIAGVISRPPDEWGITEAVMEFAYIRNGVMEIDKIHQLQQTRPEFELYNGE